MDMFVVMAGTLAVLAAFFIGIFTGRALRESPKPMMPIVPMVPDDVQRQKYEADQKALQDCLNYSIDVAYKKGE